MMHLLMVAVLKFDATYATLADQLGHLKPPCIITAPICKNLPEKTTYWIVAIYVALMPLLTSPHQMAVHKEGERKDGTSGEVLASESRESRHALYSKMAAS